MNRLALTTILALAPVAACFSERVSEPPPSGQELCEGDPGPNIVQIRDFAFHPAQLQVSAGTEVTWVNCDAESHTSTADEGEWNSGLLATNATFTHTFEQSGDFAYHCEPHPFMTAVVSVED